MGTELVGDHLSRGSNFMGFILAEADLEAQAVSTGKGL